MCYQYTYIYIYLYSLCKTVGINVHLHWLSSALLLFYDFFFFMLTMSVSYCGLYIPLSRNLDVNKFISVRYLTDTSYYKQEIPASDSSCWYDESIVDVHCMFTLLQSHFHNLLPVLAHAANQKNSRNLTFRGWRRLANCRVLFAATNTYVIANCGYDMVKVDACRVHVQQTLVRSIIHSPAVCCHIAVHTSWHCHFYI